LKTYNYHNFATPALTINLKTESYEEKFYQKFRVQLDAATRIEQLRETDVLSYETIKSLLQIAGKAHELFIDSEGN